jgi:hypothetical protein
MEPPCVLQAYAVPEEIGGMSIKALGDQGYAFEVRMLKEAKDCLNQLVWERLELAGS